MHILLTGSSGFLGKHLQKEIKGSFVTIGRGDATIVCDLSTQIPILPNADMVIHCAGKAHSVPKTNAEKQAFFDVNVKGTENLLKGLELAPELPRAFVFISSVAVYGVDMGVNISEIHPLCATDPYGASKIEAEKIVQAWCTKNNVICGILRLPLLVGPNPPGNLGAMIKGVKKGYYFNIAGGSAKKSMVMAEDVAKIIPMLAEKGGVYNLTDGYHPSFQELSMTIAQQLGKSKILNMPYWLARLLAKVGDALGNFPINSAKLSKITSDLTFDDSKAQLELGWSPKSVLENFKI